MVVRPTWEVRRFLLTVVYGTSDDVVKEKFLDELLSISLNSQVQWVVLGDFNLIYKARDKNNLNLNRQLMGRFRRSLDMCELFEFALQNRRYTWSNERALPTLMWLDHVFCNEDWDLMHGDFKLMALSLSLSDHCLLLLFHQEKPTIHDSFRFENFWPRVPGFKEVVHEAWNEMVPCISPLNILFFKLQMPLSAETVEEKAFGELKERTSYGKQDNPSPRHGPIQDACQLSDEEVQLGRDLKTRVLGLTAVEHAQRRQTSRMIWLKEGDACTTFFHLKANSQSRKKFIPYLKNNISDYVWSHDEKEQVLYEYFLNILGSGELRQSVIN
jgi:hypothetical protein